MQSAQSKCIDRWGMWKGPKVESRLRLYLPVKAQEADLVLGHPRQRHRSGLMIYEARSL